VTLLPIVTDDGSTGDRWVVQAPFWAEPGCMQDTDLTTTIWTRFLTASSRLLPGLAATAVAVGVAYTIQGFAGALSPLVIAVVLGALAVNLGLLPGGTQAGTAFAARHLLRVGVVLLGFRLALGDVASLGGPGLVMVAVVVVLTFAGTRWLGRRLGLSPGLSLLTATGFAICGASAVAAMESVIDADEEEVAFAVALVTACGTLAMITLPLVAVPLDLGAHAYGIWVGASVHDVAQVVATAAVRGQAALDAAVVVKLTRVLLLAPLVAGVGAMRRRSVRRSVGGDARARRTPGVPLFVVGFLAAAALRSVGAVPAAWLAGIGEGQAVLFTAALFGLGTGVQIDRLRVIGGRPLVLGLLAWVLVALVAYGGALVVGG
jgi:uncharacterized integral membrane protein (TIGR00698 family)